ncbi:hypothetical protein [Burkholderia dolosa]|uniref:hypothetical protein n=1 Tax=Burkholderia dolosa TaxID=152500 RepID=UPI0027D2CE72|nr:hypothetical protein [Burkholderia dolosa]
MKIEIQLDEIHNTVNVTAGNKTVIIHTNPESLQNIKSKKNGDFDFTRQALNETLDALNKAQETK